MGSGDLFEALSHPLRIEILKLLAKGPKRFSDIKRELKIESSGLLDFHLKKLDNLVSVNSEGYYVLNEKGFAALQTVETPIEVWLAEESLLPKPFSEHHGELVRFFGN